jgi:hypothetical protein
MKKWSIIVECEEENMRHFNFKFIEGEYLTIPLIFVKAIIFCDDNKKEMVIK